jgi:hypothetical protein
MPGLVIFTDSFSTSSFSTLVRSSRDLKAKSVVDRSCQYDYDRISVCATEQLAVIMMRKGKATQLEVGDPDPLGLIQESKMG